jgi:saccharopine dehydrogenase-like NADP-dependent oxidoreductase
MKDGKRVVTTAPLKCAEYRDDFSVSMKLESYPNRDSTVFQERFGMKDCHTFIRGTLRFAGFSSIISAFHDIGLTSDDKAPQSVKILRDLLEFRLQNTSFTSHPNQKFIEKATSGMSSQDVSLMKKAFMKIDFSHLKGNEHKTHQAITSIVKTMKFLGFFETNCTVKNDGSQSCLDILSQVMAVRLAMDDQDRDLVFMRHIFHIMDPRTNETWEHTSTMVASGESEASGGKTMMSKTVGITCGIATRMVLEDKIREKGVLSPITREIYNPILSELEKRGIRMIEES